MRFAAVLSDLDGVLVDSGAAVERVWREWAVSQSLDADEVVGAMHGVPARHVIARVAPWLDPVTEGERVDRLHAASGCVALPGGAEFLAAVAPLAVVTSCSPPLAAARFAAAGLAPPDVLITSDLTERGKPFADPYLAAASALGVPPSDCLVIEDAPAGVAAGLAAGATVWAVETTHSRADLSDAARVLPDLWAVLDRLGLPRPTAAG
ncbi:MAG TPA: HAD-IA family hydrolase [Solirubrobacteraceae bacterium]|nr:HAD-IA family hydrolase [Solirubrobacteraceae bacterium]